MFPSNSSPTARSPSPQERATILLREAIEHHQRGELSKAESLYREALGQMPLHDGALHMLGVLKYQQRQYDEALRLIQKSIEIAPREAAAHSNLALVLQQSKNYTDAMYSCDRAIELNSGLPAAHNNRGNALHELLRYEEALGSYDTALALNPGYAEAMYNRGRALQELERNADALVSYDRAIAHGAASSEVFYNRGIAAQRLGQYDDALVSYRRALFLDASFSAARYNLANALYTLGRYDQAEASFAELLERHPDYGYAAGYLLSCRMHSCNWADFRELAERVSAGVDAGRDEVVPFIFVVSSASPEAQLQCARTYVSKKYPASSSPIWNGERYQHDRIRLAYLSSDFHNHATAYLMAGLFEAHDKKRFVTTAISFGPSDQSPMRARLQRSFDDFIEVASMSNRAIAQLIREREIDIAVDLKGYTFGCRPGILAQRPAPLQVNYLGYPGTIGASYMDYIIGDPTVTPAQSDGFYSEKIVRLPDSYQVNDWRRRIAPMTLTRAEAGLPAGFVFCCFNNNYKITPEVFEIWMRLLRGIPASVLWLREGTLTAVRNLRVEAERRGVAAARLVFAPRIEQAEHLARHRLADLFLDTLPCNAHTTASDALWAGLPVVTCTGRTFAGRVAASLLGSVDLPELVTESLEEYEALAMHLALAPDSLAALRTKLMRNRDSCPLFDTDRFARNIETAYQMMWARHQEGKPPGEMSVTAAG